MTPWLIALLFLSGASGVATTLFFWTNARLSKRRTASPGRPVGEEGEVSVLIPVRQQEPERFRQCLGSVSAQGHPFVVVGDGSDEPYRSMTIAAGGEFVHLPRTVGKKGALAAGIAQVRTPFVLLLDSDTVLPMDTVRRLQRRFTPQVGGVGANLTVSASSGVVSYCSEFVERSREVVLRAMSSQGNVMLLDGACALYRTELIRPFLRSPEFLDLRVLGRRVPLGDDWQLTGHLLEEGWAVVKDYDVRVETTAPRTFRGFARQNVRWARSGWIRFGRDLRRGTLRRGGSFYRLEVIGIYLLPLLTLSTFLARVPFTLRRGVIELLPPLLASWVQHGTLPGPGTHLAVLLVGTLPWCAEVLAGTAFLWAVHRSLTRARARTLLFGMVAATILFSATIYGLLTFWRGTEWDLPLAPSPDEIGPRRRRRAAAPAGAL